MDTGAWNTIGTVAWEALWQQVAGPIALVDLQGRHVDVNPAMCRMLGYERETLLELRPSDVTHSEDPMLNREAIERVVADSTDSFSVEKRLLRSDGSVIWVLVNSSLVTGPDGSPQLIVSQFHDITARRESEWLWQRTVANAPIGMALLDPTGYWKEVNDRLCELLGYSREELLTLHFTDLTYPDDSGEDLNVFAELLNGHRDVASLEKRYRHKEGHPLWMLVHTSVVPGPDNRPAYLVGQYEAIGDGQLRNSHLMHMALHDSLTGLANRTLLTDRLEQALADLRTGKDVLAVLLIDMDNLKPTNDNYGHDVGDQLLIMAADELLNAVRIGDTVSRVGGDEFVVLAHVDSVAAAEALRDRISTQLQTSTVVAGHSISMSASVGLATTRVPSTSADTLFRCADRDMYRRKKTGRQ